MEFKCKQSLWQYERMGFPRTFMHHKGPYCKLVLKKGRYYDVFPMPTASYGEPIHIYTIGESGKTHLIPSDRTDHCTLGLFDIFNFSLRRGKRVVIELL